MNTRLVLGVAVVATTLAAPTASEAQSWRAQAAWVAGQVGGGVFGAEVRRPLGAAPPLPLPGRPGGGPVEAPTRAWHLSGMLAAGVNGAPPADSDRSLEPLVYVHGGLLYRTGRTVPGYVGLLAASYVPVGVIGPAALLEAADVAALQVGALHGDGAWHGHAALSLSVRFLVDILGG
ncbi:MAG: hypothetical protein U5R14_01110 [Gemmatimonadota bacterium]|nr:hypothetical protein [Gemmatimonadota bacterium]